MVGASEQTKEKTMKFYIRFEMLLEGENPAKVAYRLIFNRLAGRR